jgi:hypothetical protein
MGGMLIAAVGYEISTASLNDYLYSNDMFKYTDSPNYRTPDYQKLLNHLESLTSTAVYLVYLDDNCNLENTTIRHTYLCCYADYRDRVYDCEEIMKIEIPNGFERIREVLETDGAGVKRVFGGKGHGVYRSGG